MKTNRFSRAAARLIGFLPVVLAACSTVSYLTPGSDPLTPEEHVRLGSIYERQALDHRADQEFHAALEQQPSFIPALLGLGNVAFRRGELKAAEDYYLKALNGDSTSAVATNNLAMVYIALGQLEEAERLARKALEQEGRLKPYVLDTLTRIYLKQGRYAEARSALDEAELLAPSSDQLLQADLARSREVLELSP